MATAPTLVMFVNGQADSPVEELVAGAHRAITLDTMERAMTTGGFDRTVGVTASPALAEKLRGRASVQVSRGPFHWGQRLHQLLKEEAIQEPFYIGGGSLPLLSARDFGSALKKLALGENCLVTNNRYSSDLVAFKPASALEHIELPPTDNALAQRLYWEAGLASFSLPRSARTQFDVDTPTDLLVLKLHGGAGPQATAYLGELELDTSRLQEALSFLSKPKAQVVVAGRVGSHVWSVLERRTPCRVRFLSEERGLRADGREEEARSILGFYLEEVGARRFFQALAELGNAAFVDTRVIFSHLHLRVSQTDRFLSDLGWVDQIQHPLVREFTAAALEAPIPVVLGGHSLVSGGLMALGEVASRVKIERDH